VCVDPRPDPQYLGWDGILLSHIVECRGCGAVDDYRLTTGSSLRLKARIFRSSVAASAQGRIVVGISKLWDGTLVRRPSQALARLRELTAEHPESAEAFRRLGNGCERWGLTEEAVEAWRKAIALDSAEIEAAYSLADYWLHAGSRPVEGFAQLRRALQELPKAVALKPEAGRIAAALAWLLHDVVESTDEPFALAAAWSTGKVSGQPVVTLSSVDLRKVADFERLAAFVADPEVLALDVTPELPEEEPTILQRLLDGEAPVSWSPRDRSTASDHAAP
jgi:tetratricopeptide (TPR) repeat protein